jgi:hypothetical protein
MTIADRIATLRVPGVDARNSRSHFVATSMLKFQVSGTSGSVPPSTPVASSLAAS